MSWLSVILVLGVLIFVHELGHFLVAKAAGIGVPRFSIGLGPITPLRFQRGETEYVLSWIPFGGYVKMASQEELDEIEALEGGKEAAAEFPPEKLFENKSLTARILVISAGVVMNMVFAWLAFAALLLVYGQPEDPTTRIARVDTEILPEAAAALAELPPGAEIARVNGEEIPYRSVLLRKILDAEAGRLRFELAGGSDAIEVDLSGADEPTRARVARALVPYWEARIDSVDRDPAKSAGLRAGDLVTAVDAAPVETWDDLLQIIRTSPGKTITMSVVRDGTLHEIRLEPRSVPFEDPVTRETRQIGQIGIAGYPRIEPLRIPIGFQEALVDSFRRTVWVSGQVLFILKEMIRGRISIRELGGPVLIAQVSAQAARRGFEELLALMAILSVNLAIFNLLPIPVLDGGHLVFLFLEGLRGGRPVPKPLRQRLTMAGFYLLMAFMLFAIVNDALR